MSTALRITVDDPTYLHLQDRATLLQKDPETAAGLTLKLACAHLPLSGRIVVLDQAILGELETRLGGGSVLNGQDLLTKVQRLAGIGYGNVQIPFTPGQLEEIQRRAERQGLSTEDFIARMLRKMEEMFFTHIGVG